MLSVKKGESKGPEKGVEKGVEKGGLKVVGKGVEKYNYILVVVGLPPPTLLSLDTTHAFRSSK